MRKAFLIFTLSAAAATAQPSLEDARRLYDQTNYDAALQKVNAITPKTGAVYALQGEILYGREEYKDATEALEKAIEAEPENAGYWHWLGKAHGRRAETSSVFTAPSHATRCRKAFEKAVELAPNDIDAINDLLTYYLDAPGFLGGGIDKAEGLAERIAKLDAVEHQYALAELAKKRKDYAAAESHLRKALEMEPARMGRIIDLARFLAARGRYDESDGLFERARELDAGSPKLLFAMAKTFIQSERRRDEAARLLDQYLASKLTPDNPSRNEARQLLKKARRS